MSFLIFTVFLLLLFAFSCAEKKTGDDDPGDEEEADDDDDDIPESGVGSYSVYLNMVPVQIGLNTTIENRAVFDESGKSFETQTILLSDVISAQEPFVADANKFKYELINFIDQSTNQTKSSLPGFESLSKAAFYEGEGDLGLCVGWIESGNESNSLCMMDQGTIVTHPIESEFDELQTISWINERDGDQPAHLGQTIAAFGTVTVGSGVIVSGSYLKMFASKDGYGVKIFADMSATEKDDGYAGQLMSEIHTFEGDEVFIKGRITVHEGMIEFVPSSGYHLAVLSRNNPVDASVDKTISELLDDPYRWAGALVRVNDLNFVDVDPGDSTTDWPEYGTKSKDIRVKHTSGGAKIGLPVYEGTGIPGSFKPESGFNAVGLFNISGTGYQLFPRKIEDINPSESTLSGIVRVSVNAEEAMTPVNLALLPACDHPISKGSNPVPVVSIASVIRASGITWDYKRVEYKIIASDGRKPFDPIIFDESKSGILYQGDPETKASVNSYFWEGMGLSEIYYLNDVSDVVAFRSFEPPEEGDAQHGKGVTLMVNGKKYAINFDTLQTTTYDGKEAISMSEFISDFVMDLLTMNGSFSIEQIKTLYEYRLVSFDESQEVIVRFDDLANGYMIMDDPPYTVFPGIGDSAKVGDLYTIDMMRFIEVDDGAGGDPEVIYLRDMETEEADVGEGVLEQVVFFSTILVAAGIDTSTGMYLYDFNLVASDDFGSLWPFIHNHLENMYFRPYENKGYTADPDLASYGGRVSTKAIKRIDLIDVPQEEPSIPIVGDDGVIWGSDADSCYGCHYKSDQVQIPIDCYSCHSAPR